MNPTIVFALVLASLGICRAQSLGDLNDGSYKLDTTKQSSMAKKTFTTTSIALGDKKFDTQKTYPTYPFATRSVTFDESPILDGAAVPLKTSPLSDKSSSFANKSLSPSFSAASSLSKPFAVSANSEFDFLKPSDFEKSFIAKPYTGRLPIAVNESFTERQRKELTPEQVKELINRNK